MLKKRIIPCLDIRAGRVVKGINFVGVKDAGDPVELALKYVAEGADELVFLDITATAEKRETFVPLIKEIAANINIPFTVGGGISTIEDVSKVIQAGADKVSINSAAIKNPNLITAIKNNFGSQCVVVAIDTDYVGEAWKVFSKGGLEETNLNTIDWVKVVADLGAGEILLTSIKEDGTKAGFALDVIQQVCALVNIPVIASGGAGKKEDFYDVFKQTNATAALAASIFHEDIVSISSIKNFLNIYNIPVR
ncbi:imidazole glycerol phosphate synthase subunit HisF [Putridiphycobacter roseus]|uniref:Imidazole glycerol phosphate synthase subunit HisF n=1 Tax=Putridiphycobacter roseus TaxID=2219161 RepID=A0A2W1MXT8_9FLAO|nr:imidazole glycerol phosphate synthase subunit HisF [Putridiphycobacter roseus]PZE15990.1 imidazole glycerol phosphate synthase subunit HisF [Putridiphycobacter roseus]